MVITARHSSVDYFSQVGCIFPVLGCPFTPGTQPPRGHGSTRCCLIPLHYTQDIRPSPFTKRTCPDTNTRDPPRTTPRITTCSSSLHLAPEKRLV
ncbi:hypothetical protein BaRGS_00006878, partial [Batillaria attramentaria]